MEDSEKRKQKSNRGKRRRRKYVAGVVCLDFLLFAVFLLTFCYFHHVRSLWGIKKPEMGVASGDNAQFPLKKEENPNHVVHSWVKKETVPPTCTEDGYTVYQCSECDATKSTDIVAATGHTEAKPVGVKRATENENGYTGDIRCQVCDAVLLKGYETPATYHKNTQLKNAVEATCIHTGYSGDVFCPDCGKIVAVGGELPLAGHDYEVTEVVEPTCKDVGYSVLCCKNCQAVSRGVYMGVVDHAMQKDGTCRFCGIMMADVSGDFGKSFPMKFIQDAEIVSLRNEAEILSYAAENGLELAERAETRYIALYRSHDIFMTVTETNTHINGYKVQYFYYDFYIRNLGNLSTAYSSQRESVGNLIRYTEKNVGPVVAAVNGDFIGNENYCRTCYRNGQLIRETDNLSGDVCVLNYDGTFACYQRGEFSVSMFDEKPPYQVWNFGPNLIDREGNAILSYNSLDPYVIGQRHPRMGMGYYEPGHYCFIAVPGRCSTSSGCRVEELANLFVEYGCAAAYNLDGGDSAQGWVEDTPVMIAERNGTNQRLLWDIICISEIRSEETK